MMIQLDVPSMTLERIYQTIPKHDAGIVMGDVGHMIMEKNCDFVTSRDLVISRTMLPHKNIHLHTWISPDGLAATQRSCHD